MSMTIGELVGYIRADDGQFVRTLDQDEARMRGLQRGMDGRLRDMRGRFVSEGALMGDALGDGIGDGGDRAHFSLSRVAGLAGGLGSVAAQAALIALKLGAVVPVAAGLAAALVQILPAAGLAATGILGVIALQAALKIGMQGVGDAAKAAFDPSDPEAYAEALKKLAPTARAFVQQLHQMQPALHALQQEVQGELFRGLDKQLKSTARVSMPAFKAALLNSALALNLMGRGVAASVRDLAKSGALDSALSNASMGILNLAGLPGVVVKALGQIGAAAGPAFARLTDSAGGALDRLSGKLTAAFQSGAMRDAIETAIGLIGDLVDVAGNVGQILGSVFKAAQVSGGGFIGTLQTITGSLADAFASPAVQGGLKALFGTMSTLAKTVGPLLGAALAAVGPVLAALGPPAQRLVVALGAALMPIIKALGPVLATAATAVGALVDAALPLLPVVGQLAAALLPALTPILASVTTVFMALAPVVRQVAAVLGPALMPIITGLSAVLVQLVQQGANQFLGILRQLMPIIPSLTPVLLQLGQSFGQILLALAPLLPQITLFSAQMISAVLPAILPLLPPLAQLITLMVRLGTWAITTVVIPALSGLFAVLGAMRSAMAPAIAAVRWLVNGVVSLFRWLYNILVGHSIIPDLVNAIVHWFAGLPGRAVAAIASLPGRLAGVALAAGRRMVSAVRSGVSNAVSAVRRLPGLARSALGNLGGYLYNSGRSLLSGFVRGIQSMAGRVRSAASSVLHAARNLFPHSPAKEGPFAGRGWTLYSGHAIGDALAAGMTSRVGAVAGAARALAGTAQLGLAGAGSPMAGLVSGPGARTGAGVTAPAGGGAVAGAVRVILDLTGADDDLLRRIRKSVRVEGGDVQVVLGGR